MLGQQLGEGLAGTDSRHPNRGRVLPEGTPFAAYVIEGLIGSGGTARVYRARHSALGHEVALKVFEPPAALGPSDLARFLREAQLAAAIRNLHVVRTLDAGMHDGLPYVVMELLEGQDLEARLRSERAVEELALIELAIPIVAGLMALHAQGLVHGDLGPGNVFLVRTPQGPDTPKLLDVGISKPHRGLRLTAAARQRLMGSPLYMAPEALLGSELTPASDQYSLGMILYECVTGVNPFVSSSLKESVRLIIIGERLPVLEQSIAPSPGLASIIERASSVAPEQRYADLASLGRALLRLADQRTRATWEFSFQSAAAPAAGSARASLASSGSARWKGVAVALALLGWGTAGVLALQAAKRESGEQDALLLAARPAEQAPQQRYLALHAPSTVPALAAAPCIPGSAAEAVSSAARALAPSPGPALLPNEPATVELATPAEIARPADLSPVPVPALVPNDVNVPLEEAGEPAAPHRTSSRVTPRGTNNAPIFE